VGEVTKTVAQRKLEDVKKKIRRGVYGYEDVTLEELESDYIEHVKSVKKLRTWKGRKAQIRVLMAFFGVKKLSQITPRDVEDFKISQLRTHKPSSINRTLATLRHIYNLARRWKKFYGENPVSVSGLLTEDNLRDRVLSFDEEERLLSASAEHLKPIIIAALNTGMRRGEILSLKWGNVDLENGLIIITPVNNKSKKTKRVPVNSILSAMLRELKFRNQKKSEYVFLSDDDKPVKSIKTSFNNACRRAGIQGLRFHDLRHTAGTRMSESGAGIVEISKILGHSSVELTMKRYLHPEDSLRDAAEKLGKFNVNRSKNRSNEEMETT
jgi:integrase